MIRPIRDIMNVIRLLLLSLLSSLGEAFVVTKTHGFLSPVNERPVEQSYTNGLECVLLRSSKSKVLQQFSTELNVKKSKTLEDTQEKNKIDYGKIAVMLVNPKNPYSWFLYAISAICILNWGK